MRQFNYWIQYYKAMVIIASSSCLLLSTFLPLVLGLFNADELKLMNYEVDILSVPIKANEDLDLPVVHMTSKYGQQYQCMLPHSIRLAEEAAGLSKDADETTVPEIQDLLKPLRTGPCLIKPKDWWTYEFCVGRHIRQYHIEDSQIAGPIVSLGVYDSDYDWSSETDQDDYAKLKQTRFHSQFYVNGSSCDLTGTPRTTEVRFFCEVDAGDYISRVDEPETCRYILTVHTHRVCSHPYLKPAPSTKPHTIQCNPVLEEEHYAKYLERTQEEQHKAERKRQEWIADQQRQLEELKLRVQQQKDKHKNKEEAKESEEVNVESLNDDGEEDEDNDPVMVEYDDALSAMTEKERLQVLKDRMKLQEAITQEFDTIIEEAEEELQQEMEEGARQTAYSKLASTLSRLISKLDKAEKDVAQATARFKKVQGQIGKLQAITEEDTAEVPANKVKEIEDVLEAKKKTDEEDESKLMPDFDNKVRVRIRKVDHEGSNRLEEGSKSPWFQQKELDESQKTKLEEAVKDKLQKAGLDASGRRIEVKIITAGYYNDEEDGKNYHILSDEDTAQFQNMILTLLTGSQEARREVERQRQLEKNYQFVWGEDQPTTTEDSEDS